MRLSEYDDDELLEEVKHRGFEIKVHVSGVELELYIGGEQFGNITAK